MTERTPQPRSYSSDSPVTNFDADRFRRAPFAKAIAETISSLRDPSSTAIGIYGPWGDGKSSVLNFLRQELEKFDSIAVITFNPWRFGDEATLLGTFFKKLATALDVSLTSTTEQVAQVIKDYVKCIPKVGDAAKEVLTTLGTVDLDDLKSRLQKHLDEKGKRIVVLMDDIDRLDMTEIQTVFRLIKLTADFNHVAYVLTFDEAVVAASLQTRYGSLKDSGQAFLEKIIQIPLHLPKIPSAILSEFGLQCVREACESASVTLSPEENDDFLKYFDLFKGRLLTPRQCKRYGNALTFAFGLLHGEVSPVDLLAIEGIRVACPALYEVIRQHRDVFLGAYKGGGSAAPTGDEIRRSLVEKAAAGFDAIDKESVERLVSRLFPWAEKTLAASEYDKRADEQRASSPYYFDRFFTYAVPQTQIPDQNIADFMSGISSRSVAENAEAIKQMIRSVPAPGGDKLIYQLRLRRRLLKPERCPALVRVLVSMGSEFQERLKGHVVDNSEDAVLLVRQLVLNVHEWKGARFDLAKTICQDAEPVLFGYDCARVLCKKITSQRRWSAVYGRISIDHAYEDELICSAGEWEELKGILAERMRTTANDDNLYRHEEREIAKRRIEAWLTCAGRNAVRTAIADAVKSEPHRALGIVAWYVRDPESGTFVHEQYEAVARVVDPAVLVEAIGRLYPVKDGRLLPFDGEESLEQQIAIAFMAMHGAETEPTSDKKKTPE